MLPSATKCYLVLVLPSANCCYPQVLSTTYNSALLAWVPGFDGGAQQTFRIRWRAADSEGFQFAEVAGGSSRHEVAGLRVDTTYTFSVMAVTRLGASSYTGPGVEARTASKYTT